MNYKKIMITGFIFSCFISFTAFAEITVTMYLIPPKIKENNKTENANQPKKEIGTLTFRNTLYGMMMKPDLKGLQPGMHGMHLHAVASCDHYGQDAGGHYDPKNTGEHLGPYNPRGHLGDLPALYVDKEGVANHQILAPRLHEDDLYNHAVIVHMGDDNYSDLPKPLGGGGDRVACGIIKK